MYSVDSDRSLEGLVLVVVVTLQTSRTLWVSVDADAGTPPVRGSGGVTGVVPAELVGTLATHCSCSTATPLVIDDDIAVDVDMDPLLPLDHGCHTRPGCPNTGYKVSAQSTPVAR